MAEKKKKKIEAVDVKRATVVTGLAGGSYDVAAGDVLIVGTDISELDAGFLCACSKAEGCSRSLKGQREAAAKKAAEKAAEKTPDK